MIMHIELPEKLTRFQVMLVRRDCLCARFLLLRRMLQLCDGMLLTFVPRSYILQTHPSRWGEFAHLNWSGICRTPLLSCRVCTPAPSQHDLSRSLT